MTTAIAPKVPHDDAVYPLLVMDAGAPGQHGGSADDPQRLVDNALRMVLGSRTRVGDAAGFRAALARSFVQTEVNGRRTYRNVPRGTIADTADEGDLSGVQATLLARARDAVEHGIPLLDGLRILNPAGDLQDADAFRAVVRTAVIRLRDEFGRRDGPRAVLVDAQLLILFGDVASEAVKPDEVLGVLGSIRDHFGLSSGAASLANTVEEEQHVTSFMLLVEYVVGLRQSWRTAAPLFGGGASGQAFVSARLRHLDLSMQTIAETVDRVRHQLDTVYVGEAERRIQPLRLPSLSNDSLTIEDLLEWADEVVAPDSAAILRDGGRIVIADSLLPNARRVREILAEVITTPLPGGLGAPRVTAALAELNAQFASLVSDLERLTPAARTGPTSGRTVDVPNVVARPILEAQDAIREAGLKVARIDLVDSSVEPVGIVTMTEPSAGVPLHPDDGVNLKVSRGPIPQVPKDDTAQLLQKSTEEDWVRVWENTRTALRSVCQVKDWDKRLGEALTRDLTFKLLEALKNSAGASETEKPS